MVRCFNDYGRPETKGPQYEDCEKPGSDRQAGAQVHHMSSQSNFCLTKHKQQWQCVYLQERKQQWQSVYLQERKQQWQCVYLQERKQHRQCVYLQTQTTMALCLSAAGEFEVDCSANSLIATRSRWDNFQRSGSRQPSTSALFSSVTYQFLGLSLSHTTAKRQGEVFNSLDFISTQPHQIFSSLPRAVHERYESIRSCVSYVPCPTGSAFPSFHFLLQ